MHPQISFNTISITIIITIIRVNLFAGANQKTVAENETLVYFQITLEHLS